jgi:hypothetical protein
MTKAPRNAVARALEGPDEKTIEDVRRNLSRERTLDLGDDLGECRHSDAGIDIDATLVSLKDTGDADCRGGHWFLINPADWSEV